MRTKTKKGNLGQREGGKRKSLPVSSPLFFSSPSLCSLPIRRSPAPWRRRGGPYAEGRRAPCPGRRRRGRPERHSSPSSERAAAGQLPCSRRRRRAAPAAGAGKGAALSAAAGEEGKQEGQGRRLCIRSGAPCRGLPSRGERKRQEAGRRRSDLRFFVIVHFGNKLHFVLFLHLRSLFLSLSAQRPLQRRQQRLLLSKP